MSRVEGADEMVKALSRLGAEAPRIQDDMLSVAGEVMAYGWRAGISERGYIRSHEMVDSVNYKLITRGGIKKVVITAQGTDSRGVRNAAKAYMLHYGTSRIRGSHWLDPVEDQNMPVAVDAMRDVLGTAIETIIGG